MLLMCVAIINNTLWGFQARRNQLADKVEVFGSLQEGDSVISNAADEIKEDVKMG